LPTDRAAPVVWQKSPLFELALALVRLDRVASSIVNANDGIGFGITTAESKAD